MNSNVTGTAASPVSPPAAPPPAESGEHSTPGPPAVGHQNATVNRAPVRYRRAGGAKEPGRESWEKPPDRRAAKWLWALISQLITPKEWSLTVKSRDAPAGHITSTRMSWSWA